MPVEIYTSDKMGPRPLRAFVYGPPRTGKTTYAGTWPSPIFLSAGNEGGDTTLRFLPGVTIAKICSKADMEEAVKTIQQQHVQRGWQTVVVDSISFYADIFIAEVASKKGAMTQRDWGALDLHLQKWLLPTLHNLPLHVLWIALSQHKERGDSGVFETQPMLYGKTATKLPAATDMIMYSSQSPIPGQNGKMESKFQLHTRSHNNAIAGDRFGNAFADGVLDPHFQYIAQRIGSYIGVRTRQPVGGGNAQPAPNQ